MVYILKKVSFKNESHIYYSKKEAFDIMKKYGYILYYEQGSFYSETTKTYYSRYYFHEKGLAHKMHCKLEYALQRTYGYMPEWNMPYILEIEE